MRLRTSWIATLIVVVGLATPVAAQQWKGTARATGIVKDTDGKPVQGARVLLHQMADRSQGPEAIETDKKGRWAIGGLTAGRWGMRIEAEGFETLVSSVIAQATVSPPFVTELQPEGAGGAAGSEVREWIDAGNQLLEQEKLPEARVEYDKAIGALSGAGKAEVLRAVARTYFLEQNATGAISSLQRAIVAAPKDKISADLYKSLMETMGRPGEAKTFLRQVAKGEITAADVEPPASEPAAEGEGGS